MEHLPPPPPAPGVGLADGSLYEEHGGKIDRERVHRASLSQGLLRKVRQIVTDAPKRHKPRDARPTGTISAAAPPRRQSVASSCG